jgi:hypothetical protein
MLVNISYMEISIIQSPFLVFFIAESVTLVVKAKKFKICHTLNRNPTQTTHQNGAKQTTFRSGSRISGTGGATSENGHTRRELEAPSGGLGAWGPSPEKFENSSANMRFAGIYKV